MKQTFSRSTTVKRADMPKTLGERIMDNVPERKDFTGQVNVEVHCKEGSVKDVYLTMRRKLVE